MSSSRSAEGVKLFHQKCLNKLFHKSTTDVIRNPKDNFENTACEN